MSHTRYVLRPEDRGRIAARYDRHENGLLLPLHKAVRDAVYADIAETPAR